LFRARALGKRLVAIEVVQFGTEKGLRALRDAYVDYKQERANLEAMNVSRVLIQNLKDEAIIKLRELSLYNENTKAAYDVLFSRLPGIGD
jgi:hypothetical protein